MQTTSKKSKRIICVSIMFILLAGLIFAMSKGVFACSDYGYEFHFNVDGGNGEITLENEDLLKEVDMCNEGPWCELECVNTSRFITLLGGKKGRHKLTFIAIPDEDYQVKEWIFNGEIVEGNKTNSYEAIVSSEQKYKGVISVRFEPVQV